MFRRTLSSVAPALAALVVATPALAQPVANSSDLAARTEAKGYIAISKALAERSRAATPPDLAGRTEAKGYLAISKALAERSRVATSVDVAGTTEGFDWSDAGIGAAAGAGVVLLLLGALMLVRHGRTEPRPA